MKKITTIAILLFSMASYAQGNLQFNQVLTYNGTLIPTSSTSTLYTVPIGKVCKIEAMSTSSGSTTCASLGFYINNILFENMTQTNSVCVPTPQHIVWLKAGDQVKFIANSQVLLYPAPYFLSMIEYNIVQ